MKLRRYYLIGVALFFGLGMKAQEDPVPKIGLCLSGGGAKGLAHIGLLKLIDSLGIKVDYITGTSMGSIVGGLYACGYTGKQIDSIAHSIEWDVILNQYVPMDEIYIDEKDEYGRYIGEIPLKGRKVQVTGFIEGQELLCLLTRLTKNVNQVIDFTKLPTPFKCMAVDIVSVTPVVMDRGSLAIALRASMSIPTVFKPVKIDNKLLVDGGLMVNFPVQQLKDMGADIVIGSYTGGRLMAENEMNTFNKLLVQSSSFYGINESKEAIALCNIFNNLTDSMRQYGAGDFKRSNQIVKTGIAMSYNVLPQLVELANRQKARGLVYKRQDLIQSTSCLKVEDIVIDPVCSPSWQRFIRNRITFSKGDSINFKDLENTVEKLYGTRNFIKVYDILEPQENGNYLVKLKMEKDIRFRLKGAVHYDTENGTGFIVNLTARNWLGNGSRLVVTTDLSEALKYRLHYRQYIGQTNLSFNTEFSRVKSFLQWKDSQGKLMATDSYKDIYKCLHVGFNYNLALPLSIYLGAIGEAERLSPRYKEENNNRNPGDITYFTKYLESRSAGIIGQMRFNTLNRFVFPDKGIDILVENKLALLPIETVEGSVVTMDSGYVQFPYSNWHESEQFYKEVYLFAPYDRLSVKAGSILPLTKSISFLCNLAMGFTYYGGIRYDTAKLNIQYNYYNNTAVPTMDNFFIGGVDERGRTGSHVLWGLNEGERIENNFSALRLGFQCELKHNLFVTPFAGYFYSSSSYVHFFRFIGAPNTNGSEYQPYKTYEYGFENVDYRYTYRAFLTYGLNIGYKSPLGPIGFNISKPSLDKRWRAYFSLGYRF